MDNPEHTFGLLTLTVGAEFTAICKVVVVAQEPTAGVKVYVVVVVLFSAGDQVPEIGGELVELVGKGAIVLPAQTGATALKVGVEGVLLIAMVIVAGNAQVNELLGVKVYVVVVVLFGAGDQVPDIADELVDVVGKVKSSPTQNGPI